MKKCVEIALLKRFELIGSFKQSNSLFLIILLITTALCVFILIAKYLKIVDAVNEPIRLCKIIVLLQIVDSEELLLNWNTLFAAFRYCCWFFIVSEYFVSDHAKGLCVYAKLSHFDMPIEQRLVLWKVLRR